MNEHLQELFGVARELTVPIIISGDIFDRWDPPVELVNFALRQFYSADDIEKFAIPGQHDLPNHEVKAMSRSAFGTLVEANVINYLRENQPMSIEMFDTIWLHGFPWGSDLHRRDDTTGDLNIAVIHKYVWRKGSSHPQADENAYYREVMRQLKGFDIVVSGDNHKGFLGLSGRLFNCGTFMRRISDERDYSPMIGLVSNQGYIIPYKTSAPDNDKFVDPSELKILLKDEVSKVDLEKLLLELQSLGEIGLDFVARVGQFLKDNRMKSSVKRTIIEILGESK